MSSPTSVTSSSPSADKLSLISSNDPLKTSNKPPPTVPARPTISKPILQTATPNAANLIAKAPSTGVSQSSILATKEKTDPDPFKPPRDRGRRAMFSDNLTLPSPTSPNIPPIIHQPVPAKEEPLGKLITPTWSTQPVAVATQPQVCRIDETDSKRDKASPEPGGDKSGFSKLISNVKRTPSMSVADKEVAAKDKDKKEGKFNSLPRKQKPERSSVRNLEISNPILQKDIEHKSGLVPVCRSPDSVHSDTMSQSSLTPPSVMPRHSSPVSIKRPAPQPPAKPAHLTSPALSPKPNLPSKEKGEAVKTPSEEKSKHSKYLPWRSNANKSSKDATEAASPDDNVHKVSSSDDIQTYKKPSDPPKSNKFTNKRRPASIATSKPSRPQAPPPKPPSSRKNSHDTSPEDIYLYDDASALRDGKAPLADIQESLSPCHNEPIYDTISEAPEMAEITSPEEFVTPVGSPTMPKKKSLDTISTGSSAAEEDLMKEILKEMHCKTEGESIYSSLMRKDKKNRKKKALE